MQFINPLFLVGLGAALLPVLYHLIRRMQARKVPFSSIMFITATKKEVVKKRRLRDLLLMAVRMMIFALLAVAFARPFMREDPIPFLTRQGDRSIVLLVDVSYSMQYGDRFERARREALRIVDRAGGNDEIAVLAFSDRVRPLTELTNDRSLVQAALQKALKPDNRTTDFYRPLRMAEDLLREARHRDRHVVLISDFQRNGWKGTMENWKLAAGVTFTPVGVGEEEAGNAYLQAVELTPVRSGSVAGLRLDARVAAGGDRARQENTASLLIGGRPVERRALEARPANRFALQRTFGRERFVQGELALEGDRLPLDDRHYFTYMIQGKPSILAVDGVPGGTTRDAFYLQSAFDMGETGPYAFSTGSVASLSPGELQRHGMVFVANVPALGGGQANALKTYVERGGTAVLSFGPLTNAAAYSATLRDLGIGTIEQVDRSGQASSVIGEVDLRHPVFDLFATSGPSIILHPQFHRYLTVQPAEGVTVIGRFDNGAPFLLERRLGTGRILVYTSSFSTDWTDFPIQEMFVPFVYQLARHAFSTAGRPQMYRVGERVPLRGRPGALWEVRTPDGKLLRVRAGETGDAAFLETEVPGHYMAAGSGTRTYFSVNVDPVESDLQARDAEEVTGAVVAPRRELPQQAAGATSARREDRELWKLVLLAAIALFALESVLANRRMAPVRPRPVVPAPARRRQTDSVSTP